MTPSQQQEKQKSSKTIAYFVFVDHLGRPITGLTVRVLSKSFCETATTDETGHGFTIENATRNETISIFIKKKSGAFEFKGKVTPKRDVNAYTIASPELHIEATTRLTPKEAAEQDLNLPIIEIGEAMTIERLLGEFAPYIGTAIKITEEGKVAKFLPPQKAVDHNTPTSNETNLIVHQYKVIKTDSPRSILFDLLGSRLSYPARTDISEEFYTSMSKELGCEAAAIKAVASTESNGSGFLENGLPKILFERHKFYSFTDPNRTQTKKILPPTPHPFAKYPDICHPDKGTYGPPSSQYNRFIKAAQLDRDAAIKSCSWGAFQILGEYYQLCGYESPTDLANDCMRSIDAHAKLLQGFLKMPEKKPALEALRKKDWIQFTSYYNGAYWRSQNPDYPIKMANYYEANKK